MIVFVIVLPVESKSPRMLQRKMEVAMRDYILCMTFGICLALMVSSAERVLNYNSSLEIQNFTDARLQRIAVGRL
jgi:hypothetical protein